MVESETTNTVQPEAGRLAGIDSPTRSVATNLIITPPPALACETYSANAMLCWKAGVGASFVPRKALIFDVLTALGFSLTANG